MSKNHFVSNEEFNKDVQKLMDDVPKDRNLAVDHPDHYNTGKIEVITFIEDQGLNFSSGNVVKYVCRAGKKDPSKTLEDLMKARNYLQFEIDRVKREQGPR